MDCDAKFRPFPDDTEIACEGEHTEAGAHQATLRDYAFEGSATTFAWFENDRRSYHGDWPGKCPDCLPDTNLPAGHEGSHVLA